MGCGIGVRISRRGHVGSIAARIARSSPSEMPRALATTLPPMSCTSTHGTSTPTVSVASEAASTTPRAQAVAAVATRLPDDVSDADAELLAELAMQSRRAGIALAGSRCCEEQAPQA